MSHLFIDIETRSPVSIGDCGSYRYIQDPGFRILLIAFAFDNGPVEVIEMRDDSWDSIAKQKQLRKCLLDPEITKVAHNASGFEIPALSKWIGKELPVEQWLDTMVMSAYCGLPLSLGQVSEALKFPVDKAKDKDGRALIRTFCVPKKSGAYTEPEDKPEEWARFIEYNRQDVVAERGVFLALQKWMPPESEHKLWCLDHRINARGVRIDTVLAREAAHMGELFKNELMNRAVALTHLDNPNSVSQVKDWLLQQEGLDVPSLNKKAVADVVAQLQTDDAKEFMAIRSMMAKTSVSKYDAMLRCTGEDGYARGCFQFYGSHTGRWAGRLIQFQNLPQNHMEDLAEAREIVREGAYNDFMVLYDNVPATLSELIRTAIIPEDGHKLVVADFSAIEARVIAYLAQEQWRLDAFKQGKDIYCESASQMFKVPVEKHGINGHLRQRGKVAELGLGFGGGVNALKAFGADKLGMTDEDMGETVALWREASPKICRLWKKLERAAIVATSRHTKADPGIPGVWYEWEDGIMWLHLPSGRRMAYYEPQYGPFAYGKGDGDCLTYMTLHQTSRKWERVQTWGGKLAENITQAIARDCLCEALLNLDTAGWDIRAHVHDEIICTEPKDGRTWQEMAELMAAPIPWAEGLPLRADGYECQFYKKD